MLQGLRETPTLLLMHWAFATGLMQFGVFRTTRQQELLLVDHTSGELAITWEQYHRLIEHLALQVHNAQAGFDQIVALSRGGLRVGDALSRVFQTPLVVMAASSYEGEDRNQGSLTLGR